MNMCEVIKRLESLQEHCKDMADDGGPERIWRRDAAALAEAIKALGAGMEAEALYEKIYTLIAYILSQADCCPFFNMWEGSELEEKCAGLGEDGCADCILENLEKLNG